MSTLKKFAGQTAIYGLSTVLSRVLNFFLTPIYVKAYSPSVFGILTYMFTWAAMCNAILAFGMETTFFRYFNKTEDKQKVYNNTFIVVLSISAVFVTIAILFAGDIAEWMHSGGTTTVSDYASYIRYFIFILVIDSISVIPFASVRANGQPLRYGIIKIINILVFISLNLLFIIFIPKLIDNSGTLSTWLSGWYREKWVGYVFISNLIASGVTLLLLLPELLRIQFKLDRALIKDMLLYSFPVLIANISFIINENLSRIALKDLLPANIAEQELGIFAACSKIAIFLSIFIQAFRLGAEPFFFSHAANKNSGETYARIMNYFIIAIALIFVALVANIEILKLFIRADNLVERAQYWSGLKVVPILLFGYVSLGIYMNLSIWYKLSDQTRYGLYISGIGAIITIVMNILFIPTHGYMASAWISLSAYTAMMVLSYILGQKNYPIPYNLKKALGYLAASVLIVWLSFYYFDRNIFAGNGLLLIFLIATFFIERKELQKLLRNDNPNN